MDEFIMEANEKFNVVDTVRDMVNSIKTCKSRIKDLEECVSASNRCICAVLESPTISDEDKKVIEDMYNEIK